MSFSILRPAVCAAVHVAHSTRAVIPFVPSRSFSCVRLVSTVQGAKPSSDIQYTTESQARADHSAPTTHAITVSAKQPSQRHDITINVSSKTAMAIHKIICSFLGITEVADRDQQVVEQQMQHVVCGSKIQLQRGDTSFEIHFKDTSGLS